MSLADSAPAVVTRRPSRARVVAAFAAVYIIWGSTYLAILYAIETLPPLVMAGVRFLIAGGVLYTWAYFRGAERPTFVNWRAAGIVGALLLLGGNGAVVWAEQRVPSGIASLLVATLPLWMVLLEWSRPEGRRPTIGVAAGIALGLAGLMVLIGPGLTSATGGVDPVGAGVLLFGSLSWAAGSLYARGAPLPKGGTLATGMEMLAGGALLLLAGLARGEAAAWDPGAVSASSLIALLYLITFGSLIGFTAYIWLLGVVQPAHVATYAYVNPIVAVLLGWAIAGETITSRTLVAAAIIVGAVALITSRRREPKSATEAGVGGSPESSAPSLRRVAASEKPAA